jgi:RNA polymerase sigma factor (sigma-70 family)
VSYDDYEPHDERDSRRLRELAALLKTGEDPRRVSELIAELIAGWKPYYFPWLELRHGTEVAEEVDGRVQVKLTELLLRTQEFDQPWGAVVWVNVKKYTLGDELRARARRSPEESVAIAPEIVADPSVAAEFEEVEGPDYDVARLNRAIACLSGKDREMIDLVFNEDLDRDKMAERLGISPGHVSVNKHRAVERLRRAWEACNEIGSATE